MSETVAPEHSATPPRRRAAFAFIFATMLLDMLALGVIVPILPKLIIEFEGGDAGQAARIVGVFGAAWALMQFFSAPILGALSDRFGRRPVLLVSLLGLGLDYILMALAPSLAWLFIGRLISGVTAATYSTANAYVADVTPQEKRAAAYGLIGAAWGLGFVVGPAVGGMLGQIDLRLPFWVAAGMTLANALYGLLVLPESLEPQNRARFSWRRANPLGALTLLRSQQGLMALAAIYFLHLLAHHCLPALFVLYADYRYGWNISTTGLSLALVGVAGVVVQGGLIRPVVRRIGERGSLLLGLAFAMVGYFGYAMASQAWMAWAIIPLMAFQGFVQPGLQGLATRRVGPSEQGRLQGALASLSGLSALVGPLLFTFIFAASVPETPGMPFFVAAGLVLVALAAALPFARPMKA